MVRLTRGIVPKKHLTAFLSTWRLLALPVYAGLPGCLSARVLLGETSPAGRVAISWPTSVGSLPVFYNHKPIIRDR